jgi:predicted MPP superfamily phosphohydrolase
MITRRRFLRASASFPASLFALSGYALGVEPLLRLSITRYVLTPANWPAGLTLRICALADIHAVNPGMSIPRIERIVEAANALEPDITLLLGDYSRGHTHGWRIPSEKWAPAIAALRAPLGVHAILGNHDWWDDFSVQQNGSGMPYGLAALESNGIPVYHNRAARLSKDGQPFWIAGLGDQLALKPFRKRHKSEAYGLDDLPGTLAQVKDDAPIILMAHEPDAFIHVPSRVALTLSGHTHGGQVRMLGYSPVVPSHFGNRFAYGHVIEGGRNLIVSGGLGCSIVPVRLGVPPEIVLIELGGQA